MEAPKKNRLYLPAVIGLIIFLLGAGLWRYLEWRKLQAELYKNVQSHIELSPGQMKAMIPAASGTLLSVFRFQDERGTWQVALGNTPSGGQNVQKMGDIHKAPVGGSVETALYLCRFPVAEGTTTLALAEDAKCRDGGTLAKPEVQGYASALIRTGYRTLRRCRTPSKGEYLSLNTRCEGPKDKYQGRAGVVRLSDIEPVP